MASAGLSELKDAVTPGIERSVEGAIRARRRDHEIDSLEGDLRRWAEGEEVWDVAAAVLKHATPWLGAWGDEEGRWYISMSNGVPGDENWEDRPHFDLEHLFAQVKIDDDELERLFERIMARRREHT